MACSLIYNLINFIWYMEELPQEWRNLFLYLFMGRIIKLTVRIIKAYYNYQLCTKFHPAFFCQVKPYMCIKLLVIIIEGVSVMYQVLIRYSAFK
jgi:hypothetical protein